FLPLPERVDPGRLREPLQCPIAAVRCTREQRLPELKPLRDLEVSRIVLVSRKHRLQCEDEAPGRIRCAVPAYPEGRGVELETRHELLGIELHARNLEKRSG